MKIQINLQTCLAILALAHTIAAASCPDLKPSYLAPVVGDGWQATLIAQNLTYPRSIIFDSNGSLLVVESSAGVVHLALTDGGGSCIGIVSRTMLINSTNVSLACTSMRRLLTLKIVKSWHCPLCRWKDPLRVDFKHGIFLDL